MGENDRNPPAQQNCELNYEHNTKGKQRPTEKQNPENRQNPKGKKSTNKTLHIATLNVLTLRTDERLEELENALQNIKWDILGLSEIRRLGDTIQEHRDYIFYYKGETKGLYGVGFIVKKDLKKNIIEFKGISERIAILNIKFPGFNKSWSIVQVYAPTEASEDDAKNNFYTDLKF